MCTIGLVLSYSDIIIAGPCDSEYTIQRSWVVTDTCQNSVMDLQNISVIDTIGPLLSLPSDTIIACEADTSVNLLGQATAIDECSSSAIVDYTDSITSGGCVNEYFINRIWNATDACGNTSSAIQTIELIDTIDPTISCPNSLTAVCSSNEIFPYQTLNEFIVAGGTAMDQCGLDSMSFTFVSDSIGMDCSMIFREYQIFDECSNLSICVQTIALTDSTPPSLICPSDITFQCDFSGIPAYSNLLEFITDGGMVSDNCNIDSLSFALISESTPSGMCPDTIQRTYELTDSCGNNSTCVQSVIALDSIAPIFNCPSITLSNCDLSDDPVFLNFNEFTNSGGTSSDVCTIDESSFQFISESAFSPGCPDTIFRVYQISDLCGNISNCTHSLMRDDAVNPLISGVPSDTLVHCASAPDPPLIGVDIVGVDFCDTLVDISLVETSTQTNDGSCSDILYTITRTWTATDDCGNTSSAVQVITMECECCDNGIDDDGNGLIDESDPMCPCSTPDFRLDCSDNLLYYFVPTVWRMNADFNGDQNVYANPSSLVITSPFGTANVTVMTGDGTTFNNSYTVNAGTPLTINLDTSLIQTPNPNIQESDRGFIITSDRLIQVIYRLAADNNKLMVTIKGEQALGRRFRAGSQTNVCGDPNTDKYENHFISVMATTDNTTVDFEFPSGLDMFNLGTTHSVVLNEGETYLVRDNNVNETVTGTLISADKPIAVVSGSQHSAQCFDSGRDGGADQLVPVCVLGTQYVVTRGIDNDDPSTANYAVIEAVTSNTEVFINGGATPVATLMPGEYYTYDMPSPDGSRHFIETSQPAYVFQFGSVQTNGEIGMAIAAPINACSGDMHIEFSEFPNSTVNTIDIIIPNDGLDSLTLNGNPYTLYSTAETIPGLPNWSVVVFDDADLALLSDPYIVESDQFFSASHFVGNPSGGTFGYLTSFKEKIDIMDPVTHMPMLFYFVDSVCGGESIVHCIEAMSCSGTYNIQGIDEGPNTGNTQIIADTSCFANQAQFEYTAGMTYTGYDTLVVRVANELGIVQPVCLSFFICGSAPIPTCSDTLLEACSILDFPPYQEFLEFENDGNEVPDGCFLDTLSFHLESETNDGNTCPTTYTRTYHVFTECSDTVECIQVITINDSIAPILACPADLTTSCSLDDFSAFIDVSEFLINGGSVSDDCILDSLSFDLFSESISSSNCIFTISRTYEISDTCGNSSLCTQVLTANNIDPPNSEFPNDTIINCLSDTIPSVTGFATGMDPCNTAVDVSYVDVIIPGNCPQEFAINRTWTLMDGCQNDTMNTQIISVLDTILPVILCPSDLVLECIEGSDYISQINSWIATATATDACDIDVTITTDYDGSSVPALSCDLSSGLTITYTATDDCGNTSSCTAAVYLDDSVNPSITCPSDLVLECADGSDYVSQINSWIATATATDACDTDVTITTDYDGSSVPALSCDLSTGLTITYTATDDCGNTSSCTATVYLDDSVNPI
ncbi:MAG: IgGFc-binding protein, partial [Nitrosomonadaceae bacterium]